MMSKEERKKLYAEIHKREEYNEGLDNCIVDLAGFIQGILETRAQGVTYSYYFSDKLSNLLISLEQVETRLKAMPFDVRDGRILNNMWDGQVMKMKEKKLVALKEYIENVEEGK
jgi:hypothetical protein